MVDSRKQDPLYVITANVQGNCDNSWKLRNVFNGPESLSSRKKVSMLPRGEQRFTRHLTSLIRRTKTIKFGNLQ